MFSSTQSHSLECLACHLASITLMTAALAVGIADSNAIAEAAHIPDSGPGRALGNLFDPPKSRITPSSCMASGNPHLIATPSLILTDIPPLQGVAAPCRGSAAPALLQACRPAQHGAEVA